MATRKPVLGIDFGTSNTSAAWVDSTGKVRTVPITPVDTAMPTVVWYAARDRTVVGAGARQKMVDDPANTIYGFKRFLGRPLKSEFVTRIRDRFPYKLVEGEDGTAAVEVHGEAKPLKNLVFLVMQRMVELANADAGFDFDECVLSVPTHYGNRQRSMLRTAAEMAGLDVRALVNEPTAAALYLSRQPGHHAQRALVFDLGGGTFDATLIQIQGSMVKVLASGGDAFLGGADFDDKIASSLARRFQQEQGIDVTQSRVVLQRLTFASEMAKIMLSTEDTANVRVMFAGEKNGRPVDLEYPVNQALLDVLVAPLVERCVGVCEDILKRSGMAPKDVGELILVGGQTRTRSLRRRIYALFPGDPGSNLTPELSVAQGAALLGSLLDNPGGPPLSDVLSVPVWLMMPGQAPRGILAAHTAVPGIGRAPVEPGPTPPTFLFYEAHDATSVDREVLGSCRPDPEWLAAHPGPWTLEAMMTQAFALEVSLRAPDGARLKMEIVTPARKK